MWKEPTAEEMCIFGLATHGRLPKPQTNTREPSPWKVRDQTWDILDDPDLAIHAACWKRDLSVRTMFDSTPLRDAWIR
eukprot:572546-Heterocapsa_arctica.AAC.1